MFYENGQAYMYEILHVHPMINLHMYLYALWLVLRQVLLSLSVPNMLYENGQAYMYEILYVHPMIMFDKS